MAHHNDHHYANGPQTQSNAGDTPLASSYLVAPAPDVVYTCPMHPQVRQGGPGNCPICGMALEPEAAAPDKPDPELIDMTRRFRIAAILSAPLVIKVMGEHFVPWFHETLSGDAERWLQMMFATPVVLWCGWPFFVRGWESILNRSLNMFTLIGLGVGVTYGYSVLVTLFPDWFRVLTGSNHPPDVYFEPAAVITALVLLGQVLELRARSQTNSAYTWITRPCPQNGPPYSRRW